MVELIGLLMMEHRLIEQITGVLEVEIQHISHDNVAHPAFIYGAVDFFRTYADRFHHGKEEDILFHELAKKPLTPIHRLVMGELMEEHRYARKTVGELMSATDKWSDGDLESLTVISDSLRRLCQLYPEHIRKEDKEKLIELDREIALITSKFSQLPKISRYELDGLRENILGKSDEGQQTLGT